MDSDACRYSGDYLKEESIEWAITHIKRFGDTDIFPVPFEYTAMSSSWNGLKPEIAALDMAKYEGRPFRRMLVPKQSGAYRVAIQLDPIDAIVYTAMAYEAAPSIEAHRTPIESKVACSYRVEIDNKGKFFRRDNGWNDFHSKSQELVKSGDYRHIATADIADFYNQIGHHRIRNSLESVGVDSHRAENVENFLMNLTRGQSRGIPIGPSASAVFAEACLSDVDSFLIRKGFVHTRYVDDFRFFCRSIEEVHKALHDLTEYLYTSHRLAIQTQKTRIYSSEQFLSEELVDPVELENRSKEEKLAKLEEFLSDYQELEEDELPDVSELVRENLVELFEACLEATPLHLGTARHLLRRAAKLRTGLLRESVLNNMNLLAPAIRDVSAYIIATTSKEWSGEVGSRFCSKCTATDYSFLAFMRIWLIEVVLTIMDNEFEPRLRSLCDEYGTNLGIRPYALLAKKMKYVDWVREQKETWQNNTPWDRRAVIWAASALSRDEQVYWLKRVQNAGDILDRAIATAVLQKR